MVLLASGRPRLRPSRRASMLVVAFGTFATGMVVVLAGVGPVSGFTASHYLVTYQDGFRRRALVGSVVAALAGDAPAPVELPAVAGLAFLAALLALAAALAAVAWTRGRHAQVLLLVALLVGASQLRVLAFDVGKFDGLLLALTFAAALATLGPARTAQVVVATIGVVGVLVHELHLVAGVPLATAMVALRHGRSGRERLVLALRVGGPAGLLGAAVAVLAGGLPGGSVAAAERLMAARAAFPLEDSVAMFLDLTLLETVAVTWDVVLGAPGQVLATALVALPSLVAGMVLLRPRRTEGGMLLAVGALTPTLLLLIAFDWYRWLTIAVINLIVAGLWSEATVDGGAAVESSEAPSEAPSTTAMVLVLGSVLLTAVSVTDALVNVRDLLA